MDCWLGRYDVPVRLISGDDRLAEEAVFRLHQCGDRDCETPWALSTRAAVHQPIGVVHKALHVAAQKALRNVS